MSFETFPLPGAGVKVDEIVSRVADQHAMLLPVVANLINGVDNAVRSQGAALGKIASRLTRGINGRTKQQGAVLNGVAESIYSAINSSIAERGQSLALQSALLPRLATQQAPPQTQPLMPGIPATFVPSVVGGAGEPPFGTTVPSTPAGVIPPPFSLTPAEIIPQQPFGDGTIARPPIRQPSLGAGGISHWMVLVDCANKRVEMLRADDPQFPSLIANGAYVPIRYEHDPLLFPPPEAGEMELSYGWLGDNLDRQAEWIDIACHARENFGDKWPNNGDFPHNPPSQTQWNGLPVGDWPFDRSGRYIGA